MENRIEEKTDLQYGLLPFASACTWGGSSTALALCTVFFRGDDDDGPAQPLADSSIGYLKRTSKVK